MLLKFAPLLGFTAAQIQFLADGPDLNFNKWAVNGSDFVVQASWGWQNNTVPNQKNSTALNAGALFNFADQKDLIDNGRGSCTIDTGNLDVAFISIFGVDIAQKNSAGKYTFFYLNHDDTEAEIAAKAAQAQADSDGINAAVEAHNAQLNSQANNNQNQDDQNDRKRRSPDEVDIKDLPAFEGGFLVYVNDGEDTPTLGDISITCQNQTGPAGGNAYFMNGPQHPEEVNHTACFSIHKRNLDSDSDDREFSNEVNNTAEAYVGQANKALSNNINSVIIQFPEFPPLNMRMHDPRFTVAETVDDNTKIIVGGFDNANMEQICYDAEFQVVDGEVKQVPFYDVTLVVDRND
jgi:hypothetical protein